MSPAPSPVHESTGPRSGLFSRLRTALRRTRESLANGLAELFSRRTINAALIDEVEELLLGADVGVDLTDRIVADLHARLKRRRLADGPAVLDALRENMVQALEPVARRWRGPGPFVAGAALRGADGRGERRRQDDDGR